MKKTNFNILLLPFGSSQSCNEEDILCERELKKYFISNADFDSTEIEVLIDYSISDKTKLFSEDEIKKIGEKTKANMVIWGDYNNRCDFDTTLVQVNYYITENENSELVSLNKYEISRLHPISNITEITDGKIIGDIKNAAYWIMGYKEFNQNNYNKAINHFLKVEAKSSKEYAQLFHSTGLAYHKLNNFLKGIALYTKAIELDSAFYWSHNNRGNCLVNIGEFDLALIDFEKVIEISEGENPDAYLNRGILFREIGQTDMALDDFNNAMLTWGKFGGSRELFSLISANRGLWVCNDCCLVEGLQDIDRALQKDPFNELLYIAKILCYMKYEDFTNAEILIKRILTINPNSVAGMTIKIYYFDNTNRKKEANQLRKKLRKLLNVPEKKIGKANILGYKIYI